MIAAVLSRSFVVVRETGGAFTAGVWSAELEEISVTGILQRLTTRQMELRTEGQKENRVEWAFYLVRGDQELRTLVEGDTSGARSAGRKADRLIADDGHQYEVVEEMPENLPTWSPRPVRHTRYALREVRPPEGGEES